MKYQFLVGSGHLPPKARDIAEKHDAKLINYTDPGCSCGRGCSGNCPNNRRHWFEADTIGYAVDSQRATAVKYDLKKAGILK